MSKKTKIFICFVFILIILFFIYICWKFIDIDFSGVEQFILVHRVLGYFVYSTVLILSVVIAPIASTPLVPFAANIWGPLTTSLLNLFNWWLGANIAFLIARYWGRPALAHLISFEKLDKLERELPEDIKFFGIALTQMIFVIEIPSYLFGLSKNIKFSTYTLATFLGMIPFSVLSAYLGVAVLKQQFLIPSLIFIAAIIIALLIKKYILK